MAVNIHGFEGADFGDPQPGSIGSGQDRFVFNGLNCGKEGEDFWHREDFGKGFGSFGVREVFYDSRLPKGYPVQKLERRHMDGLQGGRHFRFLGKMKQELANSVSSISAGTRMKYLAKSRMHLR